MEVSATVGFQLAGAASGASSKRNPPATPRVPSRIGRSCRVVAIPFGIVERIAVSPSRYRNLGRSEARLGLQPIVRRVWAPVGERPSAHHCRRYQWVYTYGFVHPDTGARYFLLLPGASVSMMQMALELFATEVNPRRQQLIILLVYQAAWHMSQKLQVPPGIFLYLLLPYTPQLQPTECVWSLLREVVANQVFDNLDALEDVLVKRCQWLMQHPSVVQGKVGFDWIQAI